MFLASESILYYHKIIFESVLLSCGQLWPLLYNEVVLLLCPDSSLTHQPGWVPFFKIRATDCDINSKSEPLLLFSPRLGVSALCQYWDRWGKVIFERCFQVDPMNHIGYTSGWHCFCCQICGSRKSCGHSPLGDSESISVSHPLLTYVCASWAQGLSLHGYCQKLRVRVSVEGYTMFIGCSCIPFHNL